MKPISELVILALAARLRGALFLSYKTLTHFIIFLFFINEIKEGKTQRGCGIVQKLVKLLQNLHFLFYFNSLKMTNKLKRTLISNLPKEKLFFVQAFNSHESLVLF